MDNIAVITVHVLNENQSEEEMHIFMQWYNRSTENKELFFQLKYIYDLLNQDHRLDSEELTESWDRLIDKINSSKTSSLSVPIFLTKTAQPPESKRKSKIRKIFFTGVTAVAIVLLFVGIRINSDYNTWIEIQSNAPREIKTVELPDGSTVRLNASSSVKYPKRFNKKSRELYLKGEAYFIVTENNKHPFFVHSDNFEIEVLGTEFNVQSYSSEDIAVTTLISGKVKLVTHDSNMDTYNEFILLPGEQAILDKESNTTKVVDVDTKDVISWLSGEYSFRNKSLKDITDRLEQIYGVTFVIKDESLKNESFTGKFFSHQTVEEIVDIINFKNKFSYKIEDDTIYMKRR